jgi:hypothetical protein
MNYRMLDSKRPQSEVLFGAWRIWQIQECLV